MDECYVGPLNRGVEPARPGEFGPVRIGPITLPVPVVLAPMAGITNAPFRSVCREFGAGLYVSEMITARALVERNPKTLRLAEFGPEESPRSLQLYGVDPEYVGKAVALGGQHVLSPAYAYCGDEEEYQIGRGKARKGFRPCVEGEF